MMTRRWRMSSMYDDPAVALWADLRSQRRRLAARLEVGSLRLHWRHHGEEMVFDLVAVARAYGFVVTVEPEADPEEAGPVLGEDEGAEGAPAGAVDGDAGAAIDET